MAFPINSKFQDIYDSYLFDDLHGSIIILKAGNFNTFTSFSEIKSEISETFDSSGLLVLIDFFLLWGKEQNCRISFNLESSSQSRVLITIKLE